MLETIMSVMEGARSVHEGYKFIHDLVCGNKQEEYLKQIASDTRDMKIHIERLSDHILYAASMDSVRAAQANQTRYVDDLKQIREILLPLQQALNEPILSSAVIFSPQQIQSPSSVLEMISELNHLVIPEPIYEGEIPVLFVENGIYHVGWQRTDILSQKLGCETLSTWQVNKIVLPDSNPVDINTLVPSSKKEKLEEISSKQGKTFHDTLKDGSEGPEMVWIPAGKFNMGDENKHEVSVDKFAMGIYPVTFAEYDSFCDATNREKPKDHGWGRDNRPVIYVSWHDAVAYTEWLSQQTGQQYRLPTEAEWEYAARAGTETDYWWGNDIDKTKANYDQNIGRTSPVGDYDANPFGLYDTAGNVWEWTCSEYKDSYNGQEKQCSTKASRFVLRGGSWFSEPRFVRSAYRFRYVPTNRGEDGGFRLVRLFTL